MYKTIITSLLILFSLTFAFAQNNAQLLQQANDFYKAEDYTKAAKLYEQILNSGQTAAELHFNLGNTYFKLGKLPQAILHFEKAKKLDPADEDTQFNLKIANMQITHKIDEIPQILVSKWFDDFTAILHSNTWTIISICLFILFITLASVFMLSANRTIKKAALPFALLFLIVSATTFGFAYKEKNALLKQKEAIVFTQTVKIKSAPKDEGTDLFYLYEGMKVEVVEENGDWREIRLKDGKRGWLKITDIEMI